MTGFLSVVSLLPLPQLRAEVNGLQVELEGKRAEMDTLETILQRRDRENQEGDNLLAMLRADLNTATKERSADPQRCGKRDFGETVTDSLHAVFGEHPCFHAFC